MKLRKKCLFEMKPKEMFHLIKNEKSERFVHQGFDFSIRRTKVYATLGCSCVKCGIEGTIFKLEEWQYANSKSLHLDLYAVLENGQNLLMTLDHVIPKSKGGPCHISNYQIMCSTCNTLKGNKLET